NMCLVLIIFFSINTFANAAVPHSKQSQEQLVKVFRDICYMNRNKIKKIPQIASLLNWKRLEDDKMFGMKRYLYGKYSILILSDLNEEFCVIGIDNDNKDFGYNLASRLIEEFPPISEVLNSKDLARGLMIQPETDIETNYKKEWLIEGGFKIEVVLTDLEYQKVENYKERYVAIQISGL
ncbi:TPA: hypothetical protein KLD56_003226, partial [Legionella pneumophila]|nr:hypothetical protein [Legionella pneumophila]